ncbi:hypothetical protein CDL15_Pgr021298 [Punica granatum]|nr:hypothetical protein CDL15_Pgr021298 [Punica granatum]PKI75148.1 hypothetical protein CRG98_004483 [Punica granatum]
MLFSVFLALFLPFAGMTVVIVIYLCLFWYSATNSHLPAMPVHMEKKAGVKGLSAEQLSSLPKVAGRDLAPGRAECAVCLDDIEAEQPARLVPGCNHSFHVECADTWLSKHPVCPVCRAVLRPEFFVCVDQSPS